MKNTYHYIISTLLILIYTIFKGNKISGAYTLPFEGYFINALPPIVLALFLSVLFFFINGRKNFSYILMVCTIISIVFGSLQFINKPIN